VVGHDGSQSEEAWVRLRCLGDGGGAVGWGLVEMSGCGGRVEAKICRLRMDEKCWWRKREFQRFWEEVERGI